MDNNGIEYTKEELEELTQNESNNDEVQSMLQQQKENELKAEVNLIYDNLQKENVLDTHEKTTSVDKIKAEYELKNKAVDVFKNNADADIYIKKFLAKSITISLIVQVAVIDIIFILLGLNIIKYDKYQFNLFIGTVFVEMVGLVTIICTYIFRNNIETLIDKIINGKSKNIQKSNKKHKEK